MGKKEDDLDLRDNIFIFCCSVIIFFMKLFDRVLKQKWGGRCWDEGKKEQKIIQVHSKRKGHCTNNQQYENQTSQTLQKMARTRHSNKHT